MFARAQSKDYIVFANAFFASEIEAPLFKLHPTFYRLLPARQHLVAAAYGLDSGHQLSWFKRLDRVIVSAELQGPQFGR